MNFFRKILLKNLVLLIFLVIFFPFSTHVFAQTNVDFGEAIGSEEGLQNQAESLADELFFDNIESIAGSACNIYGLGIDFKNAFYDGQTWAPESAILEISVLFRNESWRELIWAVTDQKEVLLKQMTQLKKRKCLLNFSEPKALVGGADSILQLRQKQLRLDRQISDLEGKVKVFTDRRWALLTDKPAFRRWDSAASSNPSLPDEYLMTDKIFYWLFELDNVAWDQVVHESRRFGERSLLDLVAVYNNIPESCFVTLNVLEDSALLFARGVSTLDNSLIAQGQDSFKDFLKKNSAVMREEYLKDCREWSLSKLHDREETSAENQYKDFLFSISYNIDLLGKALIALEEKIFTFEQRIRDGEALPDEEKKILESFRERRGEFLGLLEYYSLVLNKVGTPSSESITVLGTRLSHLAEAILGVQKDYDGNLKSRISFAERFDKRKARTFRKICSRLKKMYRESGRSTTDLPVIGFAQGKSYCQAEPDCADVNLANIKGVSEGSGKLAKCSGFLFTGSEIGRNQQVEDIISEVGDDVGFILQQRSYSDLLKTQKLYLQSMRDRYQSLYGTLDGSTEGLENILTDISDELYQKRFEKYDPSNDSVSTHFGLLRKIYEDFWKFESRQKGQCEANEKPVD